MDDARSPRLSPKAVLGLALASLLGAGAALGLAWRFGPREFPRFESRSAGRVARAWGSEEARLLLRADFARQVSGGEAVERARRALRERMARGIPAEAHAPLSAPGQVASLLRGDAMVLKALAEAAPEGAAPADPSREPASFELRSGMRNVADAAAAGDPVRLDAALELERRDSRDALLAEARALAPAERAALWSRWAEGARATAREYETLAAQGEATLPERELPLIAGDARLRALTLEPRFSDPSIALSAYPASPGRVEVRPLLAFWIPVALVGLLAGLSLAALGALMRAAATPAPARHAVETLERDRRSAPLHLVTGRDRARVARGVCELAARVLARGGRVVVVDASRSLRLHQTLGLNARLGLIECMGDRLPALGLVQYGGFTGLYLLCHGRRGGRHDWLALDQVLEELLPRFDRVILATDARVPAVVGGVLAGRWISGAWAGPEAARDRARRRAEATLAISLDDMDLSPMPKASLEAIEARLASLSVPPMAFEADEAVASAGAVPEVAVATVSADVGEAVEPRAAAVVTGDHLATDLLAEEPVAAATPRVSPPVILDCDVELRQKIRFLAWVRRMRVERQEPERAEPSFSERQL